MSKKEKTKKKFEIKQKVVQTDFYIVEASSKDEALRIYNNDPGSCECVGSVGGWSHGNADIVICEIDEE